MTLKNDYRVIILSDEFGRIKLGILGVSKTRISGIVSVKLGDVEFVYSGRKDGVNRHKVRLMMNMELQSLV